MFSAHQKCSDDQKKSPFRRTPKTLEVIPIILIIRTPVCEFHNTYRTKSCVTSVNDIRVKNYDNVKSDLLKEICDASKVTRSFFCFNEAECFEVYKVHSIDIIPKFIVPIKNIFIKIWTYFKKVHRKFY